MYHILESWVNYDSICQLFRVHGFSLARTSQMVCFLMGENIDRRTYAIINPNLYVEDDAKCCIE